VNKKVHIADIGASGGLHKRWKKSLLPVHAYLFEPDSAAAAALVSDRDSTVFPFALWDRDADDNPFYMARQDCSTSSLLRPNMPLLERWPDSERFETGNVVSMPTRTLDSLAEEGVIPALDMLKLDIQGAELGVLSHATRLLPQAIGLEVEVGFVEMYQGQPLFRDIDAFLSGHGFELFDLRRVWWQRRKPRYCAQARGQLAFGDALYFRSPENVATLAGGNPRMAASAFCIYDCYGYYDLCQRLLDYHDIFEPADRKRFAEYLAGKCRSRVPHIPLERTVENVCIRLLDFVFQRTPARHDKILGNRFFD